MPRPSANRWHLQLQRQIEENQQVLQIAKGLAATVGNDFLQSVVRHLGRCFQADCVYIAELAGAVNGETRTVAEFRKRRNASVFDQHLQGTAFPDQPVGRTIMGTRETVRSFDRKQLLAYLARHYRGPDMVVSAAGAVDHAHVVAEAELLSVMVDRPQ